MRFKFGLMIGFALGYYLGTKAGRARYVQLRQWIDKAKDSDLVDTATDKARAVVDLGVERAKDLLDRNDDPVVIDLAVGAEGYSPSR